MAKVEKLYSRRKFMTSAFAGSIATAVTADAALAHILGNQTPLTHIWETLSTNSILYREDISYIEKLYGIRIFSPPAPISVSDPEIKKHFDQPVIDSFQKNNPEGFLCPWDQPRLAVLRQTLENLPFSFYKSFTGMMNVALWQSQNMSRRRIGEADSFRGCYVDSISPAVYFVKKDLRTLNPHELNNAKQLFAHELSHHRTLKKELIRNGRNTLIDSAIDSIDLPLPSCYTLPDPDLIKTFRRHIQIIAGAEGRTTRAQLLESDLLGTCIIPQEFIANVSEKYFMGFKFFSRIFSPDLSQKQIKNLYAVLKNLIFDGFEYHLGTRLN